MRRCRECTLIKPLDEYGRCEVCATQVPAQKDSASDCFIWTQEYYAEPRAYYKHFRCIPCGRTLSKETAHQGYICPGCGYAMSPLGPPECQFK